MRIGVFVCHCGSNIAGTVDVAQLAERALTLKDVVHADHPMYTCSEPGQASIQDAIRDKKLDRVVVAACSPHMHEVTFRRCVEAGGLNPYMFEMANIREHCSWIHPDMAVGTEKAWDIIKMAVAKVRQLEPLYSNEVEVNKDVLVIGGGVAGIQAALDLADAGLKVTIVEKETTIGGTMAKLDKTFPTIDCSACILTPRMVDCAQHENITLMAYCEVDKVAGYVGNFTVDIRKKASMVDWTKCIGCEICVQKCPSKAPDKFNAGLEHDQGHLHPVPAGGAQAGRYPGGLLPLLPERQVQGLRAGVPGGRHRLRAEGRDRPEGVRRHSGGHRSGRVRLGDGLSGVRVRARSRTSSRACSTSACSTPRAPRAVTCTASATARTPRPWSSYSAWARATSRSTGPTARACAACTRPSRRC